MTSENYEIVIKSKPGAFSLNLKEVFQYKDLIGLQIKKNFALVYKQTILGPIWLVLQPLASSIIFTIVFGQIAKISTDGIPQILFYLCGTALWTTFSSSLGGISTTFMANSYLFSKVYFPRLTIPISQAVSSLLKFGIQFILVLSVYIYFIFTGYSFNVGWSILWLPALLVHMALLAMAVGIIISSFTVKYRDLSLATGLIIQLWMYASPIVYPLSGVSGWLHQVLLWNPMTSIINNFRYCLFGCGTFLVGPWIISIGITFVLLFLGIMLFNRTERNFVDII